MSACGKEKCSCYLTIGFDFVANSVTFMVFSTIFHLPTSKFYSLFHKNL